MTMKRIAEYSDIFLCGGWFFTLAWLMIRMPVSYALKNTAIPYADIAVSVLFCAIGILSGILGYAFSKKILFVPAFINFVFALLMAVFFISGIFESSGVLLTFAYCISNLFCSVFCIPGYVVVYFLIYLLISFILPTVLFVMLKIKNKNRHTD